MLSITEKIAFIEKAFGRVTLTRNGRDVLVRCPISSCGSRKDRTKKKMSIRVEDDAVHCWVCGWASRSLAPLIIKFCDAGLLAEYREKFRQQYKERVYDQGTPDKKLQLPVGYTFLPYAPKNDPDVMSVWSYIFKRGLNESHVWRFRMGLSCDPKWRSRVIMLSSDAAGQLNFYVGRAINNKIRPKYENPDGVKAIDIIFNELNIDWNNRLTLCEGPFDLTKCGDNAVCLLGSNFSEKSVLFNQIITNQTPIALALDSDMVEKTLSYARKLSEYGISVKIVDLNGRHDPGEMSQLEFVEALAAARDYSWVESFKSKLQMVL